MLLLLRHYQRLRYKSSAPSCTINPLPKISFVGSPEPIFHSSVVGYRSITVSVSCDSYVAFMVFAHPISVFFFEGEVQCPPAELPAEQSDFSWIWMHEFLV
jgi:hypothetical protein